MTNNPQVVSRNEWIRERKVYARARNPEALRALRAERPVSLRLDVTDVDQTRAAHMTGTRAEWLRSKLE